MNPSRVLVVSCSLCLSMVLIYSCGEKPKPFVGRAYGGLLFGKQYTIDVVGDSTDYQPQFDSIANVFQNLFDSNNPQSLIARYNNFQDQQKGFEFVDSTLVFGTVYDLAQDLHNHTLEYYDPTVMPLKREWMVAKMSGMIEPNLDSLFSFVGFDGVKVDLLETTDTVGNHVSILRKDDKRIELDFSDIAQAAALDHIADFLISKNVVQFNITYGRDVITHGMEVDELNIMPMGVTADTSDLKIRLVNSAFSYTNTQDKVGLVDPTYGYPVDNEMAYVGVIAPRLSEAKIFAQAFLIMGKEKAVEYYTGNEDSKIHSYMFYKEGEILTSASTNGFDSAILGTGSEQPAE